MARNLFIDFETTGLNRFSDRPVSVGARLFDTTTNKSIDFYSLIHPGYIPSDTGDIVSVDFLGRTERTGNKVFSIPSESTAIHGITNEMVSNAPSMESVFGQLNILARQADRVIAHNAPFDISIWSSNAQKVGVPIPGDLPITDTAQVARDIFHRQSSFPFMNESFSPTGPITNKLEDIASYYNIPYKSHNALEDVIALQQVYSKLPTSSVGNTPWVSPIGNDINIPIETVSNRQYKFPFASSYISALGKEEIPPIIPKKIVSPVIERSSQFLTIEKGLWKKIGIGAGILVGAGILYNNLFSAKDDNYNTIEGLPHGGMAEQSRQVHADFGSGWLRNITSKAWNLLSKKQFFPSTRYISKVLGQELGYSVEKIKEMAMFARNEGIEEFASRMNVRVVSDISEYGGNIGKTIWHPDWKEPISIVDYRAGYSIQALGQRKGITTNISEYSATKTAIFHEAMERENMKVIKQLREKGISFRGLEQKLARGKQQGISHQLASIQEELFLRHFDPVMRDFTGQIRSNEYTFSALFNPKHNTIEGMRHGGLASILRKITTAFGSKYDILRDIAKSLGKTFEQVISSPEWKEALGKATVIKKLGKGAFGQTEHLQTTFMGREINLVKKTPFVEKRAELLKEGWQPEVLDTALDPKYEGEFNRLLGETESVPSLYGYGKESLYMEHMPGKPLAELFGTGPVRMNEEARQSLFNTIEEVHKQGIYNPDIHRNNLMFDPETGRVSWLDFGLAKRNQNPLSKIDMQLRMTANIGPGERSLHASNNMAVNNPIGSSASTGGPRRSMEFVEVRGGSSTPVRNSQILEEKSIINSIHDSQIMVSHTSKMKKVMISDAFRSTQRDLAELSCSGGHGHYNRRANIMGNNIRIGHNKYFVK